MSFSCNQLVKIICCMINQHTRYLTYPMNVLVMKKFWFILYLNKQEGVVRNEYWFNDKEA